MDVNGQVYFTYSTNDGKPVIAAYPEDLFIVSLFSLDSYTPMRPVWANARLLGIADAQDEAYMQLQTQGITSQMALKTEQVFKDPNAAERLREDMKKMRGPNGSKHIPIFEQGLNPVFLRLSPKEVELLGNKQFTVNRICRMTRVPPHRVGVETGSVGTKSTSAELDEAYMRDSLNPILIKVEYAFNRLLPDGYKIEFNRKSFYAGSPWRLVEAVEREVKAGLASINEGRIDLGRETIEGGDVFAIDNNNVTYGAWPEIKEIQRQLYGNNGNANQGSPDNGSTTE
jgi:HK97 family phage portal protein